MPLFSRTNIPNSITFSLTPLGKRKAEDFNGDTESRILVAIEESGGGSNISEICASTGIGRGKVEKVLLRARRGGKVHAIRGEE